MKGNIERVLGKLEAVYGRVRPKRQRAYDMVIYAQCGYPASEEACSRGHAALVRDVGTSPDAILAAPLSSLTRAMRAGGIVPALRARRLVEVAARAKRESASSLCSRKVLKQLPTIGDPGADKILLFTHTEPIAAVPSNATQVPVRLGFGTEQRSYAATYRAAQEALDAALPRTYDARIRAHLLLKQHGQEICKRARPRCEVCPLTQDCAWFSGQTVGRGG